MSRASRASRASRSSAYHDDGLGQDGSSATELRDSTASSPAAPPSAMAAGGDGGGESADASAAARFEPTTHGVSYGAAGDGAAAASGDGGEDGGGGIDFDGDDEIISWTDPAGETHIYQENPMKVAKFILAQECFERFAYYSFTPVLKVYLEHTLGVDDAQASAMVGLFNGILFIFPLLSGALADSFLGVYRTILIFSIFYFFGLVLIDLAAIDAISQPFMVYIGLFVLITAGSGGIKSCVNVFGAAQYLPSTLKSDDPSLSKRAQRELPRHLKMITSFFSLFYASINVGSLVGGLIVPQVTHDVSFFAGYSIVVVGFFIATIVFISGQNQYVYFKPDPDRSPIVLMGKMVWRVTCNGFATRWPRCCSCCAIEASDDNEEEKDKGEEGNENSENHHHHRHHHHQGAVLTQRGGENLQPAPADHLDAATNGGDHPRHSNQNQSDKNRDNNANHNNNESAATTGGAIVATSRAEGGIVGPGDEHSSSAATTTANSEIYNGNTSNDNDNDIEPFFNFEKMKSSNGGDFDDDFVKDVLMLLRLQPLCALTIPLNMAYNQMTTAFSSQGERMDHTIGSFDFAPQAMQNIDALGVLVATFVVERWVFPWCRERRMMPAIPTRFAIGSAFGVAAMLCAFFVEHFAVRVQQEPNTVSIWLQVPQFALIACAEIFVFATSYEVAFTMAPVKLKAISSSLNLLYFSIAGFMSGALFIVCEGWMPDFDPGSKLPECQKNATEAPGNNNSSNFSTTTTTTTTVPTSTIATNTSTVPSICGQHHWGHYDLYYLVLAALCAIGIPVSLKMKDYFRELKAAVGNDADEEAEEEGAGADAGGAAGESSATASSPEEASLLEGYNEN